MKKSLHAFTLLGLSLFVFSCQKDLKSKNVAQVDGSQSVTQSKSGKTTSASGSQPISIFNPLIQGTVRGGGGVDDGHGDPCLSCLVTYPDSTAVPRSTVAFSESDCLVGAFPGPMNCGAATPPQIKLWYNDEHAMTLGVRRVNIKTNSGTTSTDYAIAPHPSGSAGGYVDNPAVGTTQQFGYASGNDVAAGGGRPLAPVLYLTDLTDNGALSRVGDWQQGGTGFYPSRVCGTWKAMVRTVDETHNPALVTITADPDPAKNYWSIPGGDAPPAGVTNEGYGAEVIWNLSDLPVQAGHKYRIEFMVHDGDQNKLGGDAGAACTVITIPSNWVSGN